MGKPISIKKQVKQALSEPDYDKIVSLALDNKKVFSILISLSFNKDDILCWRSIEAIGRAAGAVSRERDNAIVRNVVRRILWSAREESGGMGWSAPEMLAEIVCSNPRGYADLPPIIISLHEEDEEGVFLKGVLKATGRMAEAGVNEPENAHELVMDSLEVPEPQIRGLAVWAALRLGTPDLIDKISGMDSDEGSFIIYENGRLVEKKIGDLARQAVPASS